MATLARCFLFTRSCERVGVLAGPNIHCTTHPGSRSTALLKRSLHEIRAPFTLRAPAVLLFPTLLALLKPYGDALAQSPPNTLSDSSVISLITILPGDAVYSTFAHSALRVYDPALALDRAYNYGTFEFGNPIVFTARFAYGRLDYLLSSVPYPRMLHAYTRIERRAVIEQVLNLTYEERTAIFQFLEWNALPDNRTYRYDFLFDNCSTRIRDVLFERVPGLRIGNDPRGEESFREMLAPYASHRPFLRFGWELLMGSTVDRTAQPWETMFLPVDLMEVLDRAVVRTEVDERQFVATRDTIFWVEGGGMPEPTLPWPEIMGWLLFGGAFLVTIVGRRKGAGHGRWFDVAIFGLIGLAGVVMAFMWFLTLHAVTVNNWNVLWAWPVHLVAAISMSKPRRRLWLRRYLAGYAVVATVFLLGWSIWPQMMHTATIPIVLALLLRSAWLASAGGRVSDATAQAPARAN